MDRKILYTLVLLLFFAACKYEDGPAISFRSKRVRLNGIWSFNEVNVDGIDSTEAYQQRFIKINILSNHELWKLYSRDARMNFFTSNSFITAFGIFTESDKHLSINFDGNNIPNPPALGPIGGSDLQDWEILKLSNKEFWFKTSYNSREYIFKLKDK